MNPLFTKAEAEELIKMLKYSLIESINFPGKNQKTEFQVRGATTKDLFSITVFRSKINSLKYSYGARISKNGIVLLSLDINKNGKHRNPDGTILEGSHWHVYTEEHGRQYAIPATNITDLDFVQNTLFFFEKFSIIKGPVINCQSELDL